MNGDELLRALQRKLGARNQSDLARMLGKHPTQLSGFKGRALSPVTVASLIAKFHEQAITAEKLLPILQKQLKTESQAELAESLGMTSTALMNWRSRGKGLSARQLAGAIVKSGMSGGRRSLNDALRPLIELFPVERTLKSRHYAVFDGYEGGKYREQLRISLENARGIYVFFDSSGSALYVGKATQQSLWKEINNAFNRVRSRQKVKVVQHPSSKDAEFSAHRAINRHPREMKRKLNELAGYFSAYQVAPTMIANVEALIVRAFPNDLLNVKIERFRN